MIAGTEQEDELEDFAGVGVDDLNPIRFDQASAGTPATAQQEADDEAEAWSKHWGAGRQMEELQWPRDMGDDLPRSWLKNFWKHPVPFLLRLGLDGINGIRR